MKILQVLKRRLLFLRKTQSTFSCNYCEVSDAVFIPLAPAHKPHDVERAYWAREEEDHLVNLPTKSSYDSGAYRMLLPPPNITGNLHLGHALNVTVQDVIARQMRQKGYDIDWIPGTDHAGIATQVAVEKNLLSTRGKTRLDLGREKFLSEIWKWKHEKGERIKDDLKKLGCLLNWNKEYFTMDERQAEAVTTAFIRLFEDGTIVRRNAIVNWSCALQSAISDIEVSTVELKQPTEVVVPGYKYNVLFGRLFDFAYRVLDNGYSDPNATPNEIVVSTTRPETMLGDVAVAVHPFDERYEKFRNVPKVLLKHPFRDEPIPLIFDLKVNRDFGTGAVKITPAHDKNDFEIAERHKLDSIPVFSKDGRILDTFEKFKGKLRFDARDDIIEELEKMDLLRLVRGHTMNLPYCTRSNDVIEYMLLPQWFLQCQPLADRALSELHSGRLHIVPSSFENEWKRWLLSCHDWCISRQLWWGHQVPAYEVKDANGNSIWVAAKSFEEAQIKAQKKLKTEVFKLVRDTDVLDTWFSSALLPFSAHGWPHDKYKLNYPLHIMQTGHDILFFWVARMMMLGLKLTDQAPFSTILLNGIVCDARGRKMSKSLGNIVTPEQVVHGATLNELKAELDKSCEAGLINKDELSLSTLNLRKMFPEGIKDCGTDALRFTLCSYNIKNHFINFDVQLCHTNKLFLNKIWQATRFTLLSAARLNRPIKSINSLKNSELQPWDRWIVNRLNETLNICNDGHSKYNLHMSTAALKSFLYQDFCDNYLETTKANINEKNNEGFMHLNTLVTCLTLSLQAIAPFTPFIASELLQHLPLNVDVDLETFRDTQIQCEVADIIEVCESIRKLKSRNLISKKHNPQICLFAQNENGLELLNRHLPQIKALTRSSTVDLELLNEKSQFSKKLNFFSTAGPLCSFGITTNALYTDLNNKQVKTIEMNQKKLKKLLTELQKYRMRLENEAFRLLASKQVQEKYGERIKELEAEIEQLRRLVQ